MLLLAFACCASALSVPPISPPILGLGAIFLRPRGILIRPSQGEVNDLESAAKFFTLAFWQSKATATESVSNTQLLSLEKRQKAEFRRRYGQTGAPQDRRAELILCKNSKGEVIGCAGIEVDNVSTASGKSIGRLKAPLMSNLAVGKQFRRKGLAEDLVKSVEDLVLKEWGYDECFLFVEKKNRAAVKLYRKLGYKVAWEDDESSSLVPNKAGNMQYAPTVILCMKKKLNFNIFGWLNR